MAVTSTDAARVAAPVEARIPASAWLALVVFTLINMLNYLDRYVVPAVQESIKRSIGPTDAQLGFLASAFLVVYMCAAPAAGMLGDRWVRPRLVAIGVAIWSLATAAAGLAQNYPSLLAARAAVGIGEAAYGTIAPALLADAFPERLRGRVFAIFYLAIPVGSALGYVIGGAVDRAHGWRAAFFVAGAPGLLLALIALLIKDPKRGANDPAEVASAVPAAKGWIGTYRPFFSNRPYLRTVLGYAAYTFAIGGIAIWMPTFMERVRKFPPGVASIQLGYVLVVMGFGGTMLGGWLADWLRRRTKQANLWLSGVATLAAAPLALAALQASNHTTFWILLSATELLIFMSTGPINVAIVSEVPPTARAAAMALSILAIHILGDVPAPPLIGFLSDHGTLAHAVLVIPVAVLASGAIWTYAAWRASGPPARRP